MGGYRFFVFVSIALTVYASVNIYVYFRLKSALNPLGYYLWIYRILMITLICAFPSGRIIRSICFCWIENILVHLGSWWLGAMYYLFILLVMLDLFKLVDYSLKLTQRLGLKNQALNSRIFGGFVLIVLALLLVYGYFNALDLRTTEVRLKSDNRLSGLKMRAVMFSDVHIGILINEKRLSTLVDEVNKLDPDLVFIVGDLLDENAEGLKDLAAILKKLKSKYGVFGVTGNHEYYVGEKASLEFMKSAGIKVLQNEGVTVDDRVNILGLNDITAQRFGQKAPDLESLLAGTRKGLPTILLSHQPRYLDRYSSLGVDLVLCGHVHGGQMYPNRYLTNLVYSIPGKDFEIGRMKVFVSDGAGTWGPPMRIGANPEIVNIELE